LHQQLELQEAIESEFMVPMDVQKMTATEVKNKIVKLAQAYKTERLKNDEFDEAVKKAYKDLDTIKPLEGELEQKQQEHTEKGERLLSLQKETAKEKVY